MSKQRIITKAAELDALPEGSIVLDADLWAWQAFDSSWSPSRLWLSFGQEEENHTSAIDLPANILWAPKDRVN